MKKTVNFILAFAVLIFYSCGKGDLNGLVQPTCITATVPQQISLDWTSDAPSYAEVESSTNTTVPCTMPPFYDESTNELNDPPYATDYNYTTQASAIPSSTLLPSSPDDKTNAQQNELGIPQSNSNYLCQITVLSEEPGQDNCTYNGQSSSGPNYTTIWSTPGLFQNVPMYEFTTSAIANSQPGLNNEIVVDYFDVYSQCDKVTERPYFAGVAEIQVPVGVTANSIGATPVPMTNQTPVTQ